MNLPQRIATWAVMVTLVTGIATLYGTLTGGSPHIAATVGLLISAPLTAFEMFVVQRPIGAPLRRLPIAGLVVVSTAIWLVFINVGLQVGPRLYGLDPYGPDYTATTQWQDAMFALLVSIFVNAVLRVRNLVGPRVLSNFLLGRYYRPLREQRIFMFLDMADSTRLSEEPGDLEVQSLIRRFFYDVAEPVRQFGGETHRYIGDEVVVTWPLTGDERDRRCIDCVFAIQARLEAKASRYEARFGVAPDFRVGMHGGDVVASEIGDDKREIVYFGDTINTAARLASACKNVEGNFLMSRELADRIGLPESVNATPVGPLELTGKDEPFPAVTLSTSTA